MKLSEFSVKNSLLINLISVFIIVAGVLSMLNLNREAFPPVDFDEAVVRTYWLGAPAEDVEKFVTIPIEKEIRGVSGVKEFTSTSEEGVSLISITLEPAVEDKDQVIDDLETAIDRVANLPEGIEDDPMLVEIKSEEWPILDLFVAGDVPQGQLREKAEELEDVLLDVPGVASITRIGWQDPEFWVEVDPQKLIDYHVSLNEIIDALRQRNITLPGGPLKTATTEYNVRINAEFTDAAEIGEVVIRANDAGHWLRVKDVATVRAAFEDPVEISRVNGKRNLSMIVIKSVEGDVIEVTDRVKEVLDDYQQTLSQDFEVSWADDISFYVKRRLGVLKNNGLIGFILVIVLLFLFLEPLPAFVTAFGIPIALFITFIGMHMLGIAINLVSMLGLIIVLGMLVDDGIIVAENVYRYREHGMPIKDAVITGTQEVIAPVTVTILTTCAAFGPLLFMTDMIGKFIREIPMVVMLALSASLFEAFIILPSHLFDFMRISEKFHLFKTKTKAPHKAKKKRWFKIIQFWYIKFLDKALNVRYLFLVLMIGLLGSAIFLMASGKIKVILFTGEGVEEFSIRAEAPKGTPIEKTEELMKQVEAVVDSLPDRELHNYRTTIGKHQVDDVSDPNTKRGGHLAQVKVYLTPAQERRRGPKEIGASLKSQLDDLKGFEKVYAYYPKEGPPVGRDIAVGVKGDNWETLQQLSDKFYQELETIEGVSDVEKSYSFGKKQLLVDVDEALARQYYLTVDDIAFAVQAAFKGGLATTVKPKKAEEEISVLVRFPKSQRDDLKAFEDIRIQNRNGKLVPLSAVASINEQDGVYQISHLDGKRVIYVFANVDQEIITSLEVNRLLQEKFADVTKGYSGYAVEYTGEFESQMESRQNLLMSFSIAFFIIFMILATMFNSLIQPFIVMLAIPFGLIGVVYAFFFHGWPLSFFGLMGVIGLTGIVVNDSIVLVDFINRLRKRGRKRRYSLIQAGKMRVRPVLMTTLTTVGGLVSVAYGIGGGDPFLKPMALSIVWGLIFATVLILVMIPCVYAIVDDIMLLLFGRATVKADGEEM